MKTRAILLALSLPLVLAAGLARALDIQPYTAVRLQQAQAAGKPVALHFHADWCPTCRAQEQAFQTLQVDPQLQPVTLLVVNYDKERELRKSLGVRSQSAVIVFKGGRETARSGGETDPARLKDVLASAL
ncbi:MAG: thioredoxin family protein [Sulfuritalea sp.]|nr:thioredoxin family protein [Sulfuritalea sp.]